MRLPNGRFSEMTHNLLYGLLMGGDAIGFERLIIDSDLIPKKFGEVPDNARYALIVLEADATSKADITCRYLQAPPKFDQASGLYIEQLSVTVGMPLDHKAITEIKDVENLKNFRILNTEPGKINLLMVEYFG